MKTKKVKWFVFCLMLGCSAALTGLLWNYILVTKMPLLFIALSVCCSVLILLDTKSKALRRITYCLFVTVALLGFYYAMITRRPLGFYTAASAIIALSRWFIAGAKLPRRPLVTKITWAVTAVLTVALVAGILHGFWLSKSTGLQNGTSCLWSKSDEAFFDEVCPKQSTDEETVKAAYNWVLDYLEYDAEFDTEYQYFDIRRTLDTRKGICFDYSHLFAAVCRSHGVPCYILDGYNRKDRTNLHTWNRAYFNGTWWNIDVSCDDRVKGQKYGFHPLENYNSEDEEYVITRIY